MAGVCGNESRKGILMAWTSNAALVDDMDAITQECIWLIVDDCGTIEAITQDQGSATRVLTVLGGHMEVSSETWHRVGEHLPIFHH